MENQQYIQEDEIDLGEYIRIIIKRKKLILSIFFTAVVITIIVNLLMPKIYEITSIVQLGRVSEPLIKNEEAKAILLNQNSLLSVIIQLGLKINVESLKKNISIEEVKGTNLLKIKIVYPSIDDAIKINDAIINLFITQGQIIYQEQLAIIIERLKELDVEIKNAEVDIARIQILISGLNTSNNIPQSNVSFGVILLQNTFTNYGNYLNTLKNQKNSLKLILLNSKDFNIFDGPIALKYPLFNKMIQKVIIAGMLSLMFGIFLAFLFDFWQKSQS